MVVKFLCEICCKPVANLHHAIQCDNCNIWTHVKWNSINTKTYTLLQNNSAAWYYIKCSKEIYLSLNNSNEELFETNQGKNVEIKIFTKNNSEQNIDLSGKVNISSSLSNMISEEGWWLKTSLTLISWVPLKPVSN